MQTLVAVAATVGSTPAAATNLFYLMQFSYKQFSN
jgi:hypothetical protein